MADNTLTNSNMLLILIKREIWKKSISLEEEVNILRSVRPGKQAAYYFGQILKRHYK